MTIVKDFNESDLGLSGPMRLGASRYIRGTLVLVAGTATQTGILGVSATASPFVGYSAFGGAQGNLRVTWDGTSLVVTSSSATDTSTVNWYLVD